MRTMSILVALALALGVARGDVVRLRNGNKFEGKIVEESDAEVKIRTREGGLLTFPRADVAGTERAEVSIDVYTKRAAALAENDAQGHLDLADYCLKQQLPSQALAELRKVLEIDPQNAAAKAKLGPLIDQKAAQLLHSAKSLQDDGEYEKAEKPLIKVLEDYPESSLAASAQHHLARGYAARKRYDDALTRWRRALSLDPNLLDAYAGAAQAAIETSDYAEALKFTESALERGKESPRAAALRERVATLRDLVDLAKIPKSEKPDPARLTKEGNLLSRLGLAERGLGKLEAAYAAGSRDPELMGFLADQAERTGHVRYAVELCNELAKSGPQSDDLVRRRARLDRLLLIPKVLATRAKAERDKLIAQIARSGVPFAYIETALRECADRPPAAKTGLVEDSFVADEALVHVPCVFYVPKEYTPLRGWPLILALHKDGDTGKNDFYNWETVANTERCILMFPTAPRRSNDWRFDDVPLVLSALRHATKTYNIDTNRVYLGGTLTGGTLAWAAALRYPDRFAALVARNAAIDELSRLYLPAAVNVPIYQLASEYSSPDILGPLREADSKLSSWNYISRREEVPGNRHPSLPELNAKVADWLEGKVRNPYASSVRLLTFEYASAESYWVRIDRFAATVFDPDRKYEFKAPMGQEYTAEQVRGLYLAELGRNLGFVGATVQPGNRIAVTTKHVTDLTLSLSDKMIDLDKPVAVTLNGKLAFRDKVERSLDDLFESARRLRDPRMCYSAHIAIRVK